MSRRRKEHERKFILECIELYRNLPALWDTRSKDYNDRIVKNKQYELLLRKYREYYVDADKSELIRKLNSLRTNFRKEINRMRNCGESESSLWYFNEMKFLISQVEPSTSQRNLDIEDNDDADNSGTMSTSTITRRSDPPNKVARKHNAPDESTLLSSQYLQQPQSEFDKIASVWSMELQKMTLQQQMFAKKAINDILFEGQMGTLQRNSVQINTSSGPSTPQTQPSPVDCDSPHELLEHPARVAEQSESSQFDCHSP